MARSVPAAMADSPSVVAIGGGHGLAATLTALRRISHHITAVVGVSDDGGSSGRLREEFGILPPGDLRMALAALCSDDTWGRTWQDVIQHRFAGDGPLAGHSVGNLLITALWQRSGDPVQGLEWIAALLEAHGRVLPTSTIPLDIVADVRTAGGKTVEIRGQVAVATAQGEIVAVRLEPPDAKPCAEAIDAIEAADAIILGPGSWYTSVLAPLALPGLRDAVQSARGCRILIANLDPRLDNETADLSMNAQLRAVHAIAPGLRFDRVIVDPAHAGDLDAVETAAKELGAMVDTYTLTSGSGDVPGQHDPDRLAIALRGAIT